MKITVNTQTLRGMVGHVSKIMVKDPNMPLTTLIGIGVDGKTLKLTMTDMVQTLTVQTPIKSESKWDIMVSAEQFISLILKLTKEETSLEYEENKALKITSNGKYQLEIIMNDDTGGALAHPLYVFNAKTKIAATVEDTSVFATVLKLHKDSIGDDPGRVYLGGFYMDDNAVLTTNSSVLSYSEETLFKEPTLLSARVMELLSTMNGEVKIREKDGKYLFSTKTATLYAPALDGIEVFPIIELEPLIKDGYGAHVTISKSELLSTLSRLTIFADIYTSNSVTVTAGEKGLIISDSDGHGVETIEYKSKDNDYKPHTFKINAETLRKHVANLRNNLVQLYYKNDRSIKVQDGNNIQIIALLVDE